MSELKTAGEMAKILRVSERTFRKYINAYNLPFIKIGASKRFYEQKVLRCLETHGVEMSVPEAKPVKRKLGLNVNKDRQKYLEILGLAG